MSKHSKLGFTLTELMVAVVLIGLLAAIAIPTFQSSRERVQLAKLVNEFRVFADQVEVYTLETGMYPEDSSSGDIPSGLESYIPADRWLDGTPIGGVWDMEMGSFSTASALGVHQYTVDDSLLESFDKRFDDGNLTTGKFRKLDSDRYYRIIAE